MNLKTTYNLPASYKACITILTFIVCLLTPCGISAELDLGIILSERRRPCLTCTTEELGRLRQVYHSQGADREAIAVSVKDAERFIGEPIVFPPRGGGQHNQW